MTARFLNWFDWLMKWEGTTFENDPADPGGATKFGIDQRSHPDVNIQDLTRAEAARIYWKEYWSKVRAEDLPDGLGEVVADIAVNNGVSRAARWLQQCLGFSPDGVIGPITVKAAKGGNAKALTKSLLDRRESFYVSIATGAKQKFLRGWLNRNNDSRKVWNS